MKYDALCFFVTVHGFRGSGFKGWRAIKIERFEDVKDWRLARELTLKVYSLTKKASLLMISEGNPKR